MVQLEEKKEEKRWFNKMETEGKKQNKNPQNVCIKTRVLVLCTLTNELQS